MPNTSNPMFFLALFLSFACAYLLGSINFAIPISKWMYGTDIRSKGSGNAGMTNMLRSFGKKAAVLTFIGDVLKGVAAVLLARGFCLLLLPGLSTLYGAYMGAIAALLGHMFPLYFGFKGGKGISTSLGVILMLQPVLALSLFGLFLLIFAISRMVSLSGVIGISLYPITTALWCHFITGQAFWYSTVCAFIIAAIVVFMHRENITRIASGKEFKFKGGAAPAGSTPPAGKEENTAQSAGK